MDTSWLPNDFEIVKGEGTLGAFLNFEDADTTRFYCKRCWSVLFGDHPLYDRKLVVTQVVACEAYEGLRETERMPPQARHFTKDLTVEQVAALPPWRGDPARVYQGVADVGPGTVYLTRLDGIPPPAFPG